MKLVSATPIRRCTGSERKRSAGDAPSETESQDHSSLPSLSGVSGNPVPLPPRDRSRPLLASKPRHERKHPLVIPVTVTTSLHHDAEPAYLGLDDDEVFDDETPDEPVNTNQDPGISDAVLKDEDGGFDERIAIDFDLLDAMSQEGDDETKDSPDDTRISPDEIQPKEDHNTFQGFESKVKPFEISVHFESCQRPIVSHSTFRNQSEEPSQRPIEDLSAFKNQSEESSQRTIADLSAFKNQLEESSQRPIGSHSAIKDQSEHDRRTSAPLTINQRTIADLSSFKNQSEESSQTPIGCHDAFKDQSDQPSQRPIEGHSSFKNQSGNPSVDDPCRPFESSKPNDGDLKQTTEAIKPLTPYNPCEADLKALEPPQLSPPSSPRMRHRHHDDENPTRPTVSQLAERLSSFDAEMSSQLSIMAKVLQNKVSEADCLRALECTGGNVHRSIKLSRLMSLVGVTSQAGGAPRSDATPHHLLSVLESSSWDISAAASTYLASRPPQV